jgi:hypothetical protein
VAIPDWRGISGSEPFLAQNGSLSAPEPGASIAAAQIPFDEQTTALNAVVLALRWDLAGIKEQLRDTIEEKQELESMLTARIRALDTELRGAYANQDAARRLTKTYEATLARFRQTAVENICGFSAELARDIVLVSDIILVWESGLFDEKYYRQQCEEDEIPKNMPAILHYLCFEECNRHDPHPLFDGSYYRGQLEEKKFPKICWSIT